MRVRAADVALIAQVHIALASGSARRARLAAGLGQREIASALGVTRAAVSHWESGRSKPSAEHALAYGRLLQRLGRAAA